MEAKVALGRVLEGLGASWEGPGSVLGASRAPCWKTRSGFMRNPFDLDPKMKVKSIKNRFQNESEFSLRVRSGVRLLSKASNLDFDALVDTKRSFS